MPSTPFTELVGCRIPVQLAAMPGVAGPDLVAAVSRAGGLGMWGVVMTRPAAAATTLEEIASKAGAPVGVNFIMPFLDRACLEAVIPQARVVEFFYGDPDSALVDEGHQGGSLVSWQVGSADEARAAVQAGCDLVVAQGVEAGGHVRGSVRLLVLLEEVVGAVPVPVVAAGGLVSSAGVSVAMAAGADAVRVGTRFIASEESAAHPRLRRGRHRGGSRRHGVERKVLGHVAERSPSGPALLRRVGGRLGHGRGGRGRHPWGGDDHSALVTDRPRPGHKGCGGCHAALRGRGGGRRVRCTSSSGDRRGAGFGLLTRRGLSPGFSCTGSGDQP